MPRFAVRFALVAVGSLAVQGLALRPGSAGAGTAEPSVRVVPCDQTQNADASKTGDYYAETIAEIEAPAIYQVKAAGHLVDASGLPASYVLQGAPVVFGDNRVAVRCGHGIPAGNPEAEFEPLDFDSVTFVIPAH